MNTLRDFAKLFGMESIVALAGTEVIWRSGGPFRMVDGCSSLEEARQKIAARLNRGGHDMVGEGSGLGCSRCLNGGQVVPLDDDSSQIFALVGLFPDRCSRPYPERKA